MWYDIIYFIIGYLLLLILVIDLVHYLFLFQPNQILPDIRKSYREDRNPLRFLGILNG